ncbi:hypothetical protein ABZ649_30975 [Streptomyces albidoflavus]|uniref:hypothetical protein n=1 Tax=Streptomyces TaxID=1883 RepID=UPI001BED0F80|nr:MULTISPECIES: hypothetical protein [unclassified Streptomyces]MEE1721574.1 hypothetical protein [Streptomyces sp. JV186]WSB18102.1 hypothetical protein OHB37_29810 [Streptomyces albidoflavus]
MVYVRDLVRDVVAEHAGHELPLVDTLRELDDVSAVRALSSQRKGREPLGFGYAEVTALVTPVIWLVLDQVARYGVETATDKLILRGRSGMRRLLRRGPQTPEPVSIELDPGELRLVRNKIVERAIERGIDRGEAEALADGVVARIVTAGGTDSERPERPETPETPETTETPESPEMPGTPEAPETLEAPGAPETPGTPGAGS